MMNKKFFLVGLCALTLGACASEQEKQIEEPVDVLYSRASKALNDGNYKEATKFFDEVERQHPYSQWATQAQLMAAYSSYEDQRYDDAYYLKALSYYEQISDVRRDQDMTKKAMQALNALVQRFPNSQYARDAQLKMDLAQDHLAGKEMEVGRYYLNRGHVNAAINRFANVVKDYQTTTHTAEALHRLVEAYMILGLKQEATRIAAVLGYNYPGSKWYERSYALLDDQQRQQILNNRSFMDRTIESVFKPD